MRRFLSILVVISSLLSGICVPVNAESSGSLEGWSLFHSGTLDATMNIDNSEFHSGKASARLNRSTPDKSQTYAIFSYDVSVEKGKTYKYSFWAKAKNIKDIQTLIDWGPRANLDVISGTYEWTQFSFTYEHIEDTAVAKFRIIVGDPIGNLWIDDVEFCEYNNGKKGENLIANPGFEGMGAAQTENMVSASEKDEFGYDEFIASLAAASHIPVYKNDGIVIDGDVSDWEGATKVSIPEDEVHLLKYLDTPTSAKVSMSFAYNDKYLYFLTTAEDDVLYELAGSEYWKGDGLQFTLSTLDETYGIEMGCNSLGKYSLNFSELQMESLLLEVKRDGNLTQYEMAIPWDLYYGELQSKIKFSAIYNENDNDSRKHVLQLAPGIASGKTNAKFPTLHMISDSMGFFPWVEGPSESVVFEENEYSVCILNSSDEDKTFTIEVDDIKEEITVPAKRGKKTNINLAFNDVGKITKNIKVTCGDAEFIAECTSNVIATAEYYDEPLSTLEAWGEEIDTLIKECDEKDIPTDYEKPVAYILKKFINQIKLDIKNQHYENMDYTFSELERMYTRAKEDLNAYLSGEKQAYAVPKYRTGDVDIVGQTHWANTEVESTGKEEYRPVFFTGYGHFEDAMNDIPDFEILGNNTIQMGNRISVMSLIGLKDNNVPKFSIGVAGAPQVTYEIVKDKKLAQSGSNCLKIVRPLEFKSQTYGMLKQTIEVEPGATYEFGGKVKATNVTDVRMSAVQWPTDEFSERIGGNYDWKEVNYEYTMAEDQTSAMFTLTIRDKAEELLLDDLYFRKKGTKTNLLENGNFDDADYKIVDDKYVVYTYMLDDLDEILTRADESNINIAYLLSPNQMTPGMMENEALRKFAYNSKELCTYIRDDQVRRLLEIYADAILPVLSKHKSVQSLCIMNEPTFHANSVTFYDADWIQYLKDMYADDINNLNAYYGTEYKSFDEVKMPTGLEPSVLLYDYIQFNDSILYEWNLWWCDLIRKYMPDTPLHAKIMSQNFEDDSALKVHITHASDYENYAKFSDTNGCDAFNYYSTTKQKQEPGINTNPTTTSALEKSMWYDMMVSNKFRPVYDTEGHVIRDNSGNHVHDNAIHVGSDNWQAAIHGRGLVNYWVWVTDPKADKVIANSFLTRPDAIYEVSKTSLDMNRLAYEVASVADKMPQAAILLSRTSRIYDNAYMNNAYKAYEASVYTGVKTSFVTENNASWVHNYDVVIAPNVCNVERSVVEELLKYAKSGKTLIMMGRNCFTRDEKNQPHDKGLIEELYANSTVIETVNDGFKMIEPVDLKKQLTSIYNEKNMRPVRVVYADSGIDTEMIEYIYTNHDGKLLVNLNMFDWTSDRKIKILVNGEPVTSSLELRSMKEMGEVIELKSYEPILLQIDTTAVVDKSDITMQIGNPTMTVNDKRVPVDSESYDTVPLIENSRTILPIRAIMDAVGGESEWDAETRTVICKYSGQEVKMVIDEDVAYVNGEEKTLDVAPCIRNDRTMLPVRFVSESFNLNVEWDDLGRIVTIKR